MTRNKLYHVGLPSLGSQVVMAAFDGEYAAIKAKMGRDEETRETVFSALVEYGDTLRSYEVADLTGLNRGDVKTALATLVESGRVVASGLAGLPDYSIA